MKKKRKKATRRKAVMQPKSGGVNVNTVVNVNSDSGGNDADRSLNKLRQKLY